MDNKFLPQMECPPPPPATTEDGKTWMRYHMDHVVRENKKKDLDKKANILCILSLIASCLAVYLMILVIST